MDGSSIGPTTVLNMRLNGFGSVISPPQCGHESAYAGFTAAAFLPSSARMSSIWSARMSFLHCLHIVIGSANVSRWPLAFQIFGCMMIVASSPATSSRPRTVNCHQACLTFCFSSQPSGP